MLGARQAGQFQQHAGGLIGLLGQHGVGLEHGVQEFLHRFRVLAPQLGVRQQHVRARGDGVLLVERERGVVQQHVRAGHRLDAVERGRPGHRRVNLLALVGGQQVGGRQVDDGHDVAKLCHLMSRPCLANRPVFMAM
ncbi:hypothetical protein D3C78_1278240 [compost metagenome]